MFNRSCTYLAQLTDVELRWIKAFFDNATPDVTVVVNEYEDSGVVGSFSCINFLLAFAIAL